MLILLLVIIGFLGCAFSILVYGLMRAGNRADEAEDRILSIIQPESPNSSVEVLKDREKLNMIIKNRVFAKSNE